MAKTNGTADNLIKSEAQLGTTKEEDDDPQWGTWEELLLACAVNRYGTNNWDSVAVEIQKRSSSSTPLLLSPRNCRKKYLQLTRRFFTRNHRVENDRNNRGSDDDGGGAGSIITTDESVPLLEELRKLRVAELRRELERYDLSIVSLQSKVKKMKEERERSNSETREQNSSDLCSKREEEAAKRDHNEPELKREVKEEPDKSPLSVAGETIANKDELSADESVSIDRRSNHDDTGSGGNIDEGAKEPDRTGEGRDEPERTREEKPVREEDSCYGSSDSVEKEEPERVQQGVKTEPESVSDSPELVESVAESKEDGGGGDGGGREEATTTKEECSDVQSSATKSRRDGDSDHVFRGSSERDDLENKRKSPPVKIESSVESQPLIDFLEELKRHKVGSVFSRRLDSQETSHYKNLIRQHIDLETVQTRVKEGAYLDSHLKFFRDLLLLVNNAMVFFSKNTTEFLAATELRNLISNKMSQKSAKSDSVSDKQSSLQRVLSLPKKENSEPSEPLLLKPKLGGPLIFCRKRSSIAAKATGSSSGSDKKKEETMTKLDEEKSSPDAKQLPQQLPTKAEEPRITKKRSRDRFSSVSTNMKKNGKNGVNSSSKQTSASTLEKSQVKGGSSSQQPEPRSESKNRSSNADLKKRSAANFLNRMKQSSSSNNGPLLDALKSSPLTAGNSTRGGSEQKKNENVKGNGKKEQVSTKVSDAKQTKEKGSPAKKSLGRPPKKGAIASATPPPPHGKRNRDGKESESVATNHKRKRSRK